MPSTYSIFIVNLLTVNVEETADTQPRSKPMSKKRINRDRARTCGGQKKGRRCNKVDNSREISASRKIAAEIAASLREQDRVLSARSDNRDWRSPESTSRRCNVALRFIELRSRE